MQGARTYKIFWNSKQHDFWNVHKAFCEKFGVNTNVTLNYWTICELSEEQIAIFKKAIDNKFIRIVKYER